MRLQDVPADVLVLLLRAGLILVLYLFLLGVFLLARRELRQQATDAPTGPGRLVVVDAGVTGLRAGEALPLQPVTTVGRAQACTFALDDTYVSATHAVL